MPGPRHPAGLLAAYAPSREAACDLHLLTGAEENVPADANSTRRQQHSLQQILKDCGEGNRFHGYLGNGNASLTEHVAMEPTCDDVPDVPLNVV